MKNHVLVALGICFFAVPMISACNNESQGRKNTDPAFGKVVNLETVNSGSWDNRIYMTGDELTMYFQSNRAGGQGAHDIWASTRESQEEPWQEPANIGGPVNSEYEEFSVCVSPDNLSLYFSSDRPGGYGAYDIWLSTRNNMQEQWQEPENLGPAINSEYCETGPTLSPDGLELYFSDYSNTAPRPGGVGQEDIWVSRRRGVTAAWEPAENIGSVVNSGYVDFNPFLAVDGLLLFFSSQRDDNPGNKDIWYTCRASVTQPWKTPRNLGAGVNSSYNDFGGWISKDETSFYFGSNRPNGIGLVDLWMLQIDGELAY